MQLSLLAWMPAAGQTSFQQQVLSYNKNTKKKLVSYFRQLLWRLKTLFFSFLFSSFLSSLFIFYLFGEIRLVYI